MLRRKIDNYIKKDYETHRALANIMDCAEYNIAEALVLTGGNLHTKGRLVYAPVYMTMFLERNLTAPTYYKVDLRPA